MSSAEPTLQGKFGHERFELLSNKRLLSNCSELQSRATFQCDTRMLGCNDPAAALQVGTELDGIQVNNAPAHSVGPVSYLPAQIAAMT